jgi:hypothetical protein
VSGPRPARQPVSRQRGLVLRALVRPTLTCVGLVLAYYLLPLDTRLGTASAVWLVVGLIAVAVLVAVQIQEIAHSERPRIRAIQLLATSLPLFLLLFSAAYFLMGRAHTAAFTQPMNRTDALYFAITMFSTVGFGDIAPVSEPARIVAMIQMLGDLALVGFAARVVVGAVQVGLKQQALAHPHAETGSRPAETGPADTSEPDERTD